MNLWFGVAICHLGFLVWGYDLRFLICDSWLVLYIVLVLGCVLRLDYRLGFSSKFLNVVFAFTGWLCLEKKNCILWKFIAVNNYIINEIKYQVEQKKNQVKDQ